MLDKHLECNNLVCSCRLVTIMDTGLGIQPVSRLSSDERHLSGSEIERERNFWEHHNIKPLNFATNPDDCDIQSIKKPKTPRDPVSHRIIEKRRRDRINNCLADLSRLIPSNYMKQGQGRIEKTEIIEMAIRYIKQLRAKLECLEMKREQEEPSSPYLLSKACCSEKFYMGFKECEAELMRFLVENEGWDATDQICSRLMKQLDEASKKYKGSFGTTEGFGSDGKKDDCQQMSMYGSSECISVEAYNSPSLGSVYEGDMLDMVQYSNGNFGSCKMNNNKHLRTLLEKDGTNSSTEIESGFASLSNRDQDTPGNNLTNEALDSDKKSTNSTQDSLEHREDCRALCSSSRRGEDSSTYKFKQNITLRFSEEKRKASDSSSISSREGGNKIKVRRKFKVKSLSPQSDSSNYPTSDYSSNGNGTSSTGENPSQSLMTPDHSSIKEEFRLKGASLPGFILHPMGSFYLPISLTESQVSVLGLVPFFGACVQHPSTLLHPINIPVNFGSHSLTMRNISIQANLPQNHAMHCDGDQLNCQKV